MEHKNKRGALSMQMAGVAFLTFIIIAVTIGVSALVTRNLETSGSLGQRPAYHNGTCAELSYNCTNNRTISQDIFSNGTDSFLKQGTFLPTIGIILAALVVLGMVQLFRS